MTTFLPITRSIRAAAACVGLICAVLAAGISARAQDFNLSRDYTTNSNPDGVWSYGWENVLGGAFTLVTFKGHGFTENGVLFEGWSLGAGVLPGFTHFPITNSQTGTSEGGQGQYPPGAVIIYPGEAAPHNFAVLRFTAPSNGVYAIAVAARAYLIGPTSGDTDFHILSNGVSLLSQFIPPSGSTAYTNTLVLALGDTIDFAVGRGADGILYGSGLNVQLVITPQTDPAVNDLPFITQQPQHVSAKTGTRASFHVVASSPKPVQYQWYFNGEAITDETGSRLVVRPVRPRDAGTYSVRVSNAAGTVWAAAVLTVELGHSGRER